MSVRRKQLETEQKAQRDANMEMEDAESAAEEDDDDVEEAAGTKLSIEEILQEEFPV